jgi:hypothetical protein
MTVLEVAPVACPGTRSEAPGPCDPRLRSIRFDGTTEVRHFACDACGAPTYR